MTNEKVIIESHGTSLVIPNLTQRRRDSTFDIAKGIVIFLVMIGHLVPFNGFIFRVIFSFHMPFFFILSGYFAPQNLEGINLWGYIKKRFIRLMIPSYCWKIFWVITGIITCSGLKNAVYTIFFASNTEWFMHTIFEVTVLMLVFSSIMAKVEKFQINPIVFSSVVVSMAMIFNDYVVNHGYHDPTFLPIKPDTLAVSFSFAVIGFIIRKYDVVNKFFFIKNKTQLISTIPLIFMLIFLADYNARDSYVNICNAYHGKSALTFYLVAILFSLLVLEISKYLAGRRKTWAILEMFGRHSMTVYLVHGTLATVLSRVVLKVFGLSLQVMIDFPLKWIIIYFIIYVIINILIIQLMEIGGKIILARNMRKS